MDVGNPEETTISISIKTPNQAHEDQTIEGVSLNWTVKDLKRHLSTVFPSRPAVNEQRLIYSGKLLPDHLHIKDLFKQTDGVPTMHLVCPFGSQPQRQMEAKPKTNETELPCPGTSASSSFQASSSAELRHRRPNSAASAAAAAAASAQAHTTGAPSWPAAAAGPAASPMTQPAFPTYSLYSPQQLLWLQHVYARQYYMQYHAALAAARSASPAPTPTIGQYPPVPAQQVPVPAPLPNQNPINNLPVNQNPAQDAAFINPGEANQNMRMNAQGGPVMEDEEDVERDWLDWLYSAARCGVLLMIVYFNSNLSRFLLVMSTLFLMYLHTAGWFPFRRQEDQDQAQGPVHQPPPEVQRNQQNDDRHPNLADDAADRRREEPAAGDGSDGEEQLTAVLVPPHQASVMWTAWVFFKTFFSSLVPEVPRGVAN